MIWHAGFRILFTACENSTKMSVESASVLHHYNLPRIIIKEE